jgi:hypothetical protein
VKLILWIAVWWLNTSLAVGQGLQVCGKHAPNAVLAMMAFQAHQRCDGVREISDEDMGRLALADGVNVKHPRCERDLAVSSLGMMASYQQGPKEWCNLARTLISDHPLIKGLIVADDTSAKDFSKCNEIDKVDAMIHAATTICKFRITIAGETVRALASGGAQCRERDLGFLLAALSEHQRASGGGRDRADKAKASWCRSFYREHQAQFSSKGMKVLFEP